MDAIIKHYQWELDQVAFTPDKKARSVVWLNILDREHVGKSTLSSIYQSLAVKHRSSIWLYTFVILGTFAAILLTVFISSIILTCHLVTWRKHIINIVTLILPKPVLRLMQPAIPSAPEIQPL